MQLSDRNLCDGTGNRFSMFWALECPYGVPCEGCQGCGWNLFLKIWESVGQITYAYSVPGILARRLRRGTIPGTLASMIGKDEGTAIADYANARNRRFCDAMVFAVRPYSYPDDDSIERGFTLFHNERI